MPGKIRKFLYEKTYGVKVGLNVGSSCASPSHPSAFHAGDLLGVSVGDMLGLKVGDNEGVNVGLKVGLSVFVCPSPVHPSSFQDGDFVGDTDL